MNQHTEDHGERDLFELAKAVAIREREVSISLLQRRLTLGYAKAIDLMAALEEGGVVTKLTAENIRTLTPAYMTPIRNTGPIDE